MCSQYPDAGVGGCWAAGATGRYCHYGSAQRAPGTQIFCEGAPCAWPFAKVGCPHKVAEGRLPARGGRTHSTTSLATPRSLQGVALAHLCKVRSSSQVATRPTGTPTDNKRLVLPTRPPTGFAHTGRPYTSWPHGHHCPHKC